MAMNRKLKMFAWAAGASVILAGAGGLGAVYAQQQGYVGEDAEEVNALQRVKISMTDAIAAAERETKGKALEASLEVERGQTYYEVEVFSEQGLLEVHVDADSGAVLKNTRNFKVD